MNCNRKKESEWAARLFGDVGRGPRKTKRIARIHDTACNQYDDTSQSALRWISPEKITLPSNLDPCSRRQEWNIYLHTSTVLLQTRNSAGKVNNDPKIALRSIDDVVRSSSCQLFLVARVSSQTKSIMPHRYSGEMPHGEKTSEFLFRIRSNYFHCDTTEWTNSCVNTIDTFNRVMFLPTDYKAEFRLE